MSFLTAVTEHELAELPMPTWAYGVTALVIFLVLGIVIWTFRDVSNRHAAKADAYAAAHGGTTSHPSATSHGGH